MTELRSQVISGLRWQAVAKFGGQLISWAATIFMMRLLAPADYGLMSMTMMLFGLTALIAELGLGSALVQSAVVTIAQQRQIFGLAILVNLGVYLALVAAAPLAASLFAEPRLIALTLVMGLQLPFGSLAVVPDAMARRNMHFKSLSMVELATQLGTVAATVVGALLGLGVWALVGGHLVGTLVRCALLIGHFGLVRPTFELAGQGQMVRFGGALTINRIIWYFFSQADVLIAGRMLGPQLLGIYSVAVNLANMPMQKIVGISNQVAFSALSRLNVDPPARNAALLNTVELISVLSVSLLWGLAAVSPELIPLLLGTKWIEAVLPLQIVAAIVPLRVISATLSTGLIASGEVPEDLKNTLVGLSILVPAFYLGARFGGVNGLALGWALAFPLFCLILIRRASRKLGFTMGAVFMKVKSSLLAGGVMVATVFTTRASWPYSGGVPLLLAEVALAAVAYVGFLFATNRTVLLEARALFRSTSRPVTL